MSVPELSAIPNSDLPPPSAELVLLRTGAQAVIRALGRKRGEKFLREWASLLQTAETVQALIPTRPRSQQAELTRSQREALAWYRQVLPIMIDTLPPE